MLKKLFYASASVLMLAFAYHLGATNAQGQAGNAVTGFAYVPSNGGQQGLYVMTPNGDVFAHVFSPQLPQISGAPAYIGNFWGFGPTPAAQQTFGQLKAQYRK